MCDVAELDAYKIDQHETLFAVIHRKIGTWDEDVCVPEGVRRHSTRVS